MLLDAQSQTYLYSLLKIDFPYQLNEVAAQTYIWSPDPWLQIDFLEIITPSRNKIPPF